MGVEVRFCKQCEGPIPLGNGNPAHYQQRVYCGPTCSHKAAAIRTRALQKPAEFLVESGWTIEATKIGGRFRAAAFRTNARAEAVTVEAATLVIAWQRLWKAVQEQAGTTRLSIPTISREGRRTAADSS